MTVETCADEAIWAIIVAWGQGQPPDAAQRQRLKRWMRKTHQSAVWQLLDEALEPALVRRGQLLQTVCAQWASGELRLPVVGPWSDWVVPLWLLWLPLAQRIDQAQRLLHRPFIQGVLGGQGVGKTTLTQIVRLILGCLGQRAVGLSIDDLYLSYEERCALQQRDPRLVWRGPPGTHDVTLGLRTLAAIRQHDLTQSVALPQFDKSACGGQGDRTVPAIVPPPTVVVFEGWFVGAQPISSDIINRPDFRFPDPIVTDEDQQFARDCNQRLRAYLPMWSFLDSLMVLQPQDYRFSLPWRQAAEQKMIASGRAGLDETQIADFVRYFWKALHPELFVTPLALSNKTSLVVNICHDHQLDNLYLP